MELVPEDLKGFGFYSEVKGPHSDWISRHRLWLDFVEKMADAYNAGSALPTGPSPVPLNPPGLMRPNRNSEKVILCSPHPDDEALVGALPLRLRKEGGAEVVNCAITLGSNKEARARRLLEVEASCRALGFRLVVPNPPKALDSVTPDRRKAFAREWAGKVDLLREIFVQERPDVVFLPHLEDFNSTHIGTHYLAMDALAFYLQGGHRKAVLLVETEYWHEMKDPNLMVGLSPELVAILVMAVAEHGGEVARNPYHLRHPTRLINNVRRGSEVVGGQGTAGSPFVFAELYRVCLMKGVEIISAGNRRRIAKPADKIDVRQLMHQFYPDLGMRNYRETL